MSRFMLLARDIKIHRNFIIKAKQSEVLSRVERSFALSEND
jgi:hypothetical protein